MIALSAVFLLSLLPVVFAAQVISKPLGIVTSSTINDTSQFQIMTFNIRYGTALDGFNSWPFRRSLLAQVINSYSPDILCLQEALQFQIDYILEKSHRTYAAFGLGRESNLKGESTKILIDPFVFKIVEETTYWLSDTPDVPGSKSYGNNLPRIATRATLVHKASGKSFVLTNTHLDHQSVEARIKGAEQIANSSIYDRIIVTGDFNNLNNNASEELKVMERNGFSDTYFELYGTKPATYHEFTGNAERVLDAKIDYIWRKGNLKPISATIIRAKSPLNRYPSDHFPVICTFDLVIN